MKEIIEETLKDFNIPISHLRYSGKLGTYITFLIVNNSDETFSDDTNEFEEYRLQIDLYSKREYTGKEIKKIKKALKQNFDDITFTESYDNEVEKFRVMFECFYNEEVK